MPDYALGVRTLPGVERSYITIPVAQETQSRLGLVGDSSVNPQTRLTAPISRETFQRFGRKTFRRQGYYDSE